MAKKSDLLSVSEFAELAGKSEKTIYKSISTRLSPFLIEEKGRKWLKKEGLALYGVSGISTVDSTLSTSGNNGLQSKILEVLEQTIDNLGEQLHEKDCQLAKQHQQLEEKDKQAERLHQFIDQSQQLLKNAQDLQGNLQVQLMEPKEEKKNEPAHGPVSQEEKREVYDQGYLDGKNDLFEGLEKQVRAATVMQIKDMIRHIREGLVYMGEDGKVVDASQDTVYIDACTDELDQLQGEAYHRGWMDGQASKKRWPWSK
ncbi:MAG: hypothetical protein RR991_07150 [Lactococcus sp.]|uniref:hypothetical protein n=1 Tax=Lactococcus sp. TaxID=44273 RepID=UPI002FC92B57